MRRLIRTGWFEDSHRFDNLHVLPATMSLFDSKAGDWQLHRSQWAAMVIAGDPLKASRTRCPWPVRNHIERNLGRHGNATLPVDLPRNAVKDVPNSPYLECEFR